MSTKANPISWALFAVVLAPCVARGADPMVYYRCDDLCMRVAVDASCHGHNGMIWGDVRLAKGYLGDGFTFNGADTCVELDRPVQDSFTLTAWIKADVPGPAGSQACEGSGLFWSDVAGVADDFVVAVLGTKLSFFCGNPDLSVTSHADLVTGDWMHIAAVRAVPAGTIAVYIDGKLDNSISHPNTGPLNAQARLIIGANTLDRRYFTGLIDEVKIYDVALTPEEIQALAPPKLKAHKPSPADGALSVSLPLVQWSKGDTALLHDVYLGPTPELTAAHLVAPRQVFTILYYALGFQPGATYYWRVDEIEADLTTVHTGDVWSFVVQDLKAYYPTPVDGAVGVSETTPVLTWLPGRDASGHHLYFGDSHDNVRDGVFGTDKGLQIGLSFRPDILESLTTYYWRVDEMVAGGIVRTGAVWSFNTRLTVEDFEDSASAGGDERPCGWAGGTVNGTGSTIGCGPAGFPWEITVCPCAGRGSMVMGYDNTAAPFYSEAELEFSPVQDWTVGGADTVVFCVRGEACNASAQLYAVLEDAAGHIAVVQHPDDTIATVVKWTQWKIPLSNFTGVNAARVKKMSIGVGHRRVPAAGGRGFIHIDEIRLTRP